MNRSDRDWTKRWISISTSDETLRDYIIPEKFTRAPSFVSDDEAFLPASLDFEHLHHGAIARFDVPKDILIDLESIFGRFLKENGVRNGPDVGLSVKLDGQGGERKI